MKDMELDKVRRAFEHATPDVLDSVLSDCREQKGAVIMTEKKFHWSHKLIAAAAALVLVLGLGGGFGWYQYTNTPMAAVSLDVNPSIQITVNRNEKVLDAEALNRDAQIVLEDMELKGSHINVALNAILGSMLRNNYLTVDANTILISVNAKDAAAGTALQEELTAKVGQILSASDFSAAVMSQTVSTEEQIQTLAKQYDISEGKVQLIQKLLAADNHYTFESLAKLSVNELKLLSERESVHVENVTATGQASSAQYIDKEAALNAALAYAKLTDKKISKSQVELDCEDGRMIYEVEFDLDGYDYEFDVDAITGKVLKSNKEIDDDADSRPTEKPENTPVETPQTPPAETTPTQTIPPETTPPQTTPSYITPKQAKAAALKHAGVTEANAKQLECDLDKDDGKVHYDVDFETADYEYEYAVDAVSGKATLVSRERRDIDDDDDNRKPTAATSPAVTTPSYITPKQAKAAALKHAGVAEANAKQLECELDKDDGKVHYDVEFETAQYEYEYEVDAESGKATLVGRERHDIDDDDD